MLETHDENEPRISRETLKNLLDEGKKIDDREYRLHCTTWTAKTFFFFCKKLSSERENDALRSPVLRKYIESELGQAVVGISSARFNPDGWYGNRWNLWATGRRVEASPFKDEYFKVLKPVDEHPYSWKIKPEYHETIKQIISELESTVPAPN